VDTHTEKERRDQEKEEERNPEKRVLTSASIKKNILLI
jgi:hypothetical protein